MQQFLKYLKGDSVLWIVSLLMMAFSLVCVYSFVPILVKVEGGTPFKYLFKHAIYVFMGFGAMFWIHRKDPKYFSMFSKLAFYVAIGLLIFTMLFGAKVNDAGRWVRIPFIGLTFQSSDFAKIALLAYLSRMLVKKKDIMDNWKEGFIPIMLPIVVICGLILKDNFSTAALLFAISMVVLFVAKVPFGKIMTVFAGGMALIGFAVLLQKSVPELNLLPRLTTWENRILNRIDSDENIIENAQAINGQLAIYSGGLMGQGVGDGKLKEYQPEAYADFYYSSFVEEFGSLSAVILVLLYLIILYRILRIGLNAESLFQTYLCVGIGVLLLVQATVNMMVCTGIAPVTGQNMPLLAMGGSSLIMTCIELGMIQSIARMQMKSKTSTEENE